VEGEGCFWVRKKDYMLFFSLTQSSKDYALIEAIRYFISGLPQTTESTGGLAKRNSSGIRLETQDIPGKPSIVRLVITKQELIKNVLIPFFDNLS